MIQWEEVELTDATHVEINGVVHELIEGGKVEKQKSFSHGGFYSINILVNSDDYEGIHQELFPFLGIKPLRKPQPKPIEFEATFAKCNGGWQPLYSLDDGFAYKNCKTVRFRCVEILEDEE
jgi:hypothetical protein